MLLSILVSLTLTVQALTAALPEPRPELLPRECYAGEAKTRFCYKPGQGTPQNIDLNDVAVAASALREWGTAWQEKLDADGNPVLDENGISIEEPVYRFLDMNSTTAPNCGEWTIQKYQSVLIAAKLMQRAKNAVVWYGDIAVAIDGGGELATPAQKTDAIISCGTNGGSREVKADLDHEAYDPYRAAFDSGNKIYTDIVIKVVQNLEWKNAQGGGQE